MSGLLLQGTIIVGVFIGAIFAPMGMLLWTDSSWAPHPDSVPSSPEVLWTYARDLDDRLSQYVEAHPSPCPQSDQDPVIREMLRRSDERSKCAIGGGMILKRSDAMVSVSYLTPGMPPVDILGVSGSQAVWWQRGWKARVEGMLTEAGIASRAPAVASDPMDPPVIEPASRPVLPLQRPYEPR